MPATTPKSIGTPAAISAPMQAHTVYWNSFHDNVKLFLSIYFYASLMYRFSHSILLIRATCRSFVFLWETSDLVVFKLLVQAVKHAAGVFFRGKVTFQDFDKSVSLAI